MLAIEAIRFAISAVAGFAVGIFWVWLFHETVGLTPEIAVLLSIVLVALQNFLVLKHYVYKTATERSFASMLSQFALSVAGFRGLEYGLFLLFHTYLDFHYLYTIIVIRGALVIAKFAFYKLTIFRSDAVG